MAKKKLDLRKKSPAPPVSEVVPTTAPVQQLPFAPGEKIKLTPEEREVLESAGWVDGDPVPNIATLMDNIAQEQQGVVQELAESGRELPPQKISDFDDLSDEKKAEIRKAMAGMREQQKINEELSANTPENLAPGVAEALKVATDPSPPPFEEGIEVVDDPAEALEVPPTRSASTKFEASAPAPCEHCGWDPDMKVMSNPTKVDKYHFLASVLGGTRFYKELDLFGGQVTVVFRTLTTEEADVALQQTAFDHRDGKVPDQGEFFRVYSNYRLAMSIEKMSTPGSADTIPILADIEWDAPPASEDPQTALPKLEAWLHENVLNSESMRRVVGLEHQRFQRLVENLEARVDDADFWKGIGQQP
jgi:hypothetical protein